AICAVPRRFDYRHCVLRNGLRRRPGALGPIASRHVQSERFSIWSELNRVRHFPNQVVTTIDREGRMRVVALSRPRSEASPRAASSSASTAPSPIAAAGSNSSRPATVRLRRSCSRTASQSSRRWQKWMAYVDDPHPLRGQLMLKLETKLDLDRRSPARRRDPSTENSSAADPASLASFLPFDS